MIWEQSKSSLCDGIGCFLGYITLHSFRVRGGSRAAATSKPLEAVNYYHKVLHLGCCSSPRSTSESSVKIKNKKIQK